ncbi:MAG TPA: SH3 domain-containing protein [Burkholderiales bacterium]|nr:SH3 domain-containing protein [Burkholderiales bacterium]
MRGLAVSFLFAFASLAAAGEFRSIAENGTPMYDAPSVRAKKLFVASRLYPVEVVINIDSWVKVRDQAGDLAWVEKKTLSDKRTVIVTAAVADVRQTANDQAALVFRAQQGVALDVAEPPAGAWIRVRHAEGQSGYVKINQVWGI